MFGDPENPLRPTGVKVAEAGERGQGKPQTLVQMLPMRMFGGQFYDEQGRLSPITVIELAGEFYAPPNAVEWTRRLRPVSRWMAKQIKEKLESGKPVEVPAEDTVDVMGDENPVAKRIAEEAAERAEDARG